MEDARSLEDRVRGLEREMALLRMEVRGLGKPAVGGGASAPASESRVAPPRNVDAPPTAHPRIPDPHVGLSPARSGGEGGSASLERRIGGQVFAVAGALIVIVGLALAVKVAIDSGWFRMMPPPLRCVGIAVFGAMLLGAGEFLRTRVRPIAVAGCNAAGLGALFVSAYAAYAVFGLLAPGVAFALMAGVAGLGFAVALRHGFLSTAVLSLIGAYLVPVLLAGPLSDRTLLPFYLLVLSAAALALAVFRPRTFSPMRDVAWIGTGLIGLLWTIPVARETPGIAVGFWVAAWVLHQAELLHSASRQGLSATDGTADAGVGHRRRRIEPILLAVLTTGSVAFIVSGVLEGRTALPGWLSPAGAFAASAMLALVFGGHLRVLRDKPRTDLERLAAAHAALAGAMLLITIALALGGWAEVAAWLAMGVAAAVAGRWISSRSLEVYSVVLLGIATLRLAVYDIAAGPASVPWTSAGGIAIAPWTVLVLLAGAAWGLVAVLMLLVVRDEDGGIATRARPRFAIVAASLGLACWMLAPAGPSSDASAVCLVWLGLSLAVRACAGIEPRLRLDLLASVIGASAIGPWVIGADIPAWLASSTTPGLHPDLWRGGAVAGVLLVHAWDTRRRGTRTDLGSPWPLLASLGAAVVFAATSLEVARSAGLLAADVTARRAAVSLWWGLWGVGAVVAGFGWRVGPLRYVGLALIAVAAGKAVVLDLAGVPPLWRVASFVGLGALMLAVAVLYGRVSAIRRSGSNSRAPDDIIIPADSHERPAE